VRDELDVLLDRVADEALRADLREQISRIRAKRTFGLLFESHLPERVLLPEHTVRRGVRVVRRDNSASPTFEVLAVKGGEATIRMVRHPDGSSLTVAEAAEVVDETAPIEDLTVIADFGDPIHPGLRHLGSVHRGADKPAHVVINGENHHALELLQFTHLGKVDCIYIDPPYNKGARDWKYDNDYVDSDDAYRHSKWLAFMERRLKLVKQLLNPEASVLIVTIDETEHLRLGLRLQQIFPEAKQQVVSVTINPKGTARLNEFSRVDEYAFFVLVGGATVPMVRAGAGAREVRWKYLRRTDIASARGTVKGGRNQFYPIYIDEASGAIVKLGEPLRPEEDPRSVPAIQGAVAVFPIREDGVQLNWGLTAPSLQRALASGYVRVTEGHPNQPYTISYLSGPNITRAESGEYLIQGTREDGSKVVVVPTAWPGLRRLDQAPQLLVVRPVGDRDLRSLDLLSEKVRKGIADHTEAKITGLYEGDLAADYQ
jgi:adenine-specific DNA-methyltransferase